MILVEDSPRNTVAKWSSEASDQGLIDGVIVSPFCTSTVTNGYKPTGEVLLQRLLDDGVANLWFDAGTHALQMPAAGDFRFYDTWDLWGGSRGNLNSTATQREHIRRVFHVQSNLDVPLLCPTVLLDNPVSQASQRSLEMARIGLDIAQERGAPVFLTIAGSSTFWSAADSLDAHVGALAQLESDGWFLVQARYDASMPVPATANEVFGLCRTARSLGEDAFVHVSHGDFAALPAIAAGADSIGTGWDTRQRVCAYASYVERPPAGDGGGWFKRPSHRGLFGFLHRQHAELVATGDAALSRRLVPGVLPADAAQESFEHHAATLQALVDDLLSRGLRDRYEHLLREYNTAIDNWTDAANHARFPSDQNSWIIPFRDGLALYGAEEGW